MDPRLAALVRLLELERLELDLFRGASRDIGSPQVFGGQVLGQALKAAYATVDPERAAHSLHAYFLKRGDFNAPIVYVVDRSRDGQSFTSRRVTALQHGEQIFHMAASFQVPQPGLEHQMAMPAVPGPEGLPDSGLPGRRLNELPEKMRQFYAQVHPFEFRMTDPIDPLQPRNAAPVQHIWVRAIDRLPDDDVLHRCLFAYVSDFHLLGTAVRPHALSFISGNLMLASIDHAMWFHRPMRIDEWLLCAMDSPSASGSRGFARASVFTRDGRLVGSTAQEGLLRLIEPPTKR
ncbi:MAG TPA: acyl-CoA thioesterase II [Steroidobacteraceae bacterium]|jgi:acyl-CoA thioesterase-2